MLARLSASLIALVALVAVETAHAKPVAAPDAVAKPVPAAKTAKTSKRGGIAASVGVRGQWKIVIRNPDGTLASTHQFENAYSNGNNALAGLLARRAHVAGMEVVLGNAVQPSQPCARSDGAKSNCLVVEPDSQWPLDSQISKNLELTASPNDPGVELRGSIISGGGAISNVSTSLITCNPDNCEEGRTKAVLTSHELDPIPVADGQQIQVTVNISFGAVAPAAAP